MNVHFLAHPTKDLSRFQPLEVKKKQKHSETDDSITLKRIMSHDSDTYFLHSLGSRLWKINGTVLDLNQAEL